MNRPTVSCCVIAKNEENHVKRWYESHKDVFDEIIFVDTGSTDNTVQIALDLGFKVHHFDWVKDFSAARNYSFSKATSDYIYWSDLDDELGNPDGFKAFRDYIMSNADYWVARYDYSHDPVTGSSVCSFARERVVKRSKGMVWRYPIHEGIVPAGGMSSVTAAYTNHFFIKHCRTEEDLKKDRSRNLGIFESMPSYLMDGRMKYYFGKELFECGKPVESIPKLKEAIDTEGMEPHDRILAIQYCCYAYFQCNQFQEVYDLALRGTKEMPNRAELWCLAGDALIKMNRAPEALPLYAAAKKCSFPSKDSPNPLFVHDATYNIYPSNQSARIYVNTGRIDDGYLEIKECLAKTPNEESEGIAAEISQMKTRQVAYKTAEPCDEIVFTCPTLGSYEWDPELAKTRHMGGSETATMEVAKWLAKLTSKKVIVFNERKTTDTFDGIDYRPFMEGVEYLSKKKPYLHIAWRHSEKLTDAPTFLWCHDLAIPGIERTGNYNKVLALSGFHKKFLMETQGLPESKIFVTRNGINPDKFKFDRPAKNPNKIIFSSSPDRGLDRAMRVLDIVRKEYPEVELHAYYGIEQLKLYNRHDMYNYLQGMIAERPWVKFHGGIAQEQLMKEMAESAIWLYPTSFLETSCITAMECLANGVYPIVRSYGALPYTLAKAHEASMASVIESDCGTDDQIALYAKEVCSAVSAKLWERVKIDINDLSWEGVAKQWLDELPKHF